MSTSTGIRKPAQDESSDLAKRLTALRAVPLLRDLGQAVLDKLAQISVLHYVPEGTIVCRQGEPSNPFYIIIEGQLSGFSTAPNGTTAVVEVIRTGDPLGLANVLAGLPRQLSAQAITPCELLAIDTAGLMALVAQETSLVTALLRAQATEFRALVRQVCDLKLRTTAQRLGCYLLELSQQTQGNTTALRLPFDKRLLAARLGCRQENLSRAFAALRSFGVETHGARVILHDIAKLRAYSEPDEPIEEVPA
ncbi:MAG TPA: cyclic nucleotide-binding domain-containing protein [Rhodopila sp.]|uniref:cyclic nucleotide-binding domain-containing protein n=1 Tax=Rhodopila sp. TaxID=2480087 RepID=UPI002B515223|nr:cyclic nucleotide-binding domain-containing protein [Rhodopila sp.]HVY15257.1 cyclic nucleotide-binding domain-containing protein [Rhodopila sp.]